MKVGIISDTHVMSRERCVVPEWVKQAFDGASMIIHAGDVEHRAYLEALNEIAPVYAVLGNCDGYSLQLPETISVDLGCGFLTAAHRAPDARHALTAESRVMVYGHSHIAAINQEDELLVINPGSPNLPRGGLPPSVAVLTVEDGKVSAELVSH